MTYSTKKNSSHPKVREIQQILNQRLGIGYRINVSGKFDDWTEAAVIQFQRQNHLGIDGKVGPQTLKALGMASNSTKSNFLYLHRSKVDAARGVTIGRMYLTAGNNAWQFFWYTYELPLILVGGKTKSDKSCVKAEKTYPLTIRTDGPKGWRLQLGDTGHRTYVQIHRANWRIGSYGCILPIGLATFNDLRIQAADGLTSSEREDIGSSSLPDLALIASEKAKVRKKYPYSEKTYETKSKYEKFLEKVARSNLSTLSIKSNAIMQELKNYFHYFGFDDDNAASLRISSEPPTGSNERMFDWHLTSVAIN